MWIPEFLSGQPFFKFCELCLVDEEAFKNFKQNRDFCEIIGNDNQSKETSDKLYNLIGDKYDYLLNNFKENDIYGNPKKYHYPKGDISSGTLYFINILDSILNRVGDIKNMNITEIGSGYGGQCKIISDYGCKSYNCIDVPQTLGLCEKYLTLLKVPNVAFYTPQYRTGDLCISNWCISEFDKDGIKWYMNNVILNHKYCYILSNAWDDRKDYMIECLSEKFDVEIFNEEPKTHDLFPGNRLIVGKCKK
jgi:putative sugar O-methyltransferase